MPKINVLVFEAYAVRGFISGEIRTIDQLLRFISKNRFNPVLVTPANDAFLERVQRKGIECAVVTPPERLLVYGGQVLRRGPVQTLLLVRDTLRYTAALIRLIRQKKIDLIYCCSLRALLMTVMAALMTRKPVVWVVNGELENPLLDTVALLLADIIIFQCDANRKDKYQFLLRFLGSKVRVIESGIDISVIDKIERSDQQEVRRELQIDSSKTNIAFVGQLSAPKGVMFLVEAFAKVQSEFPDTRLYLIGDYLSEANKGYSLELMKFIERYGIDDKVRLTGWRQDALEVLSQMNILVHPSLTEGMPRVVIEAMALGKSVIATKVGCTRNLIKQGENGMLVEPADSDGILNALRILLSDTALELRIAKAARETIVGHHNVTEKIGHLERVFESLAPDMKG